VKLRYLIVLKIFQVTRATQAEEDALEMQVFLKNIFKPLPGYSQD